MTLLGAAVLSELSRMFIRLHQCRFFFSFFLGKILQILPRGGTRVKKVTESRGGYTSGPNIGQQQEQCYVGS